MANTERHTLRELSELIKSGKKYKLFKPFEINGQIFLNVEKILTESDVMRMDRKVFGPIEVVPAVEHNTNSQIRNAIAENCVKILKTSPIFNTSESCHLDFSKRKECEKFIDGIIKENAHLAQKLLEIYQFSKKLFVHSVNVSIISVVIAIGVQEKRKQHDALAMEELFTAAALHDVGFLNLPKDMIEKRRIEYTQEEQALYKTYPELGKEITESLSGVFRKRTIDIILQHQERLTGTGFPSGLKGSAIDEMALIVGLADDFDLFLSREISNHNKGASDIMSRLSRSGSFYGSHNIDSFYTWFRYLK